MFMYSMWAAGLNAKGSDSLEVFTVAHANL